MNDEQRQRLDAYFDDQLSSPEAERLKRHIANDPESQAYLACLEQTRQALAFAHDESGQAVPGWETVKGRRAAAPPGRFAFSSLKAGFAAAAILVAGIVLWIPFRDAGVSQSVPQPAEGLVDAVELVETDLEDATPIVYLDEPSGWTVVWVMEDLPAGEI